MMTDKKERILEAALTLFSQKGYDATSTSKVAKAAGVSEGLIFRHFESKEGLLRAITDQGKQKAEGFYGRVLNQTDPKAVIRDFLEMPFVIDKGEYAFWKLFFALKWQTESVVKDFTAPVRARLTEVFEQLGSEDPQAEAEALLMWSDGVAAYLLLGKAEYPDRVRRVMKRRYGL